MISSPVPALKACVIAAVLACGHLNAHAQGELSKELDACMDKVDLGAMKNTQWAACYAEELKRQDRKLNDAYRLVQRSAPAEAKEGLVKAQRSWVAFRDNWCAYESVSGLAPGGDASRYACLVDLTSTQAKRLREQVL